MNPKQKLAEVINEVGIFGVLALLQDWFVDRQGWHATYPRIAEQLRLTFNKLRKDIKTDPETHYIEQVRNKTHGIEYDKNGREP